MALFTSKPITVNVAAATIFGKFDDLSQLQSLLDQLPEEQKQKIGQMSFTPDSIIIQTSQVGEIKFVVKERVAPEKIVFGTESSPVPLTLTANLKVVGPDTTEVTAETEVQIPAMLKPMVSGPMQKATDQFADLIAKISSVLK